MSISKSTLSQEQINKITDHINMYRLKHNAKIITYDETITNFSQSYAEKLIITNQFKHSGNKLYGENLSYFGGYKNNMVELIKKSIDSWYGEVKLYNFNNPTFSSGTGHFTQLCWDSSIKFGVGYAYNTTNRTAIITMNFSPRGNVMGLFRENVFPI
jgi:hypothetical protein